MKFKALLDTGSQLMLISRKKVDEYNIHLNFNKIRIDSLNGTTDSNYITDFLEVDVYGHTVDLPFHVDESSKYDMILGTKWFSKSSGGIYFKDGKPVLRFPDKSFYINDGTLVDDINVEEPIHDVMIAELDDENTSENFKSEENFEKCDETGITQEWDFSKNDEIKPKEELDSVQMKTFDKFIKQKAKILFAKSLNNLGVCLMFKFLIELVVGAKPVITKNFRRSEKDRLILKDHTDQLFKAGIVRYSKSPNYCQAFMVPKPNGEHRMVINYIPLNKITVKEDFTISYISDILERLAASVWYTDIDIRAGYYQIPMDEASIKLTAFYTPDGIFEFLRLAFGLCNAPAAFSRFMKILFGDLRFVEIYIDNFTIHSKTFEEHIQHVAIVLDRIREAGIKLNFDKCTFFTKQVTLLGHVISHNKIMMDPKKVDSLLKRAPPKTIKQVQQFLGLANFFRNFIIFFAKILKPIYLLLKKDTKFIWTAECQKAFEEIKNILTTYPILRQPNFKLKFRFI